MPVPVALVEDHPDLRARLAERLAFFPDVALVFAAEGGADCLARLAALPEAGRPRVVLMDIEMPGLDGVETTARLRAAYPDIDVLVLTVYDDEARIVAAVRAGASGYLLKETPTAAIVAAVRDLVGGGAPMSPAVARAVFGRVRDQRGGSPAGRAVPAGAAPGASAPGVSAREHEVLVRLVAGESEEAIADALFLSPHTVRTHVKNLYAKLDVHSRTQLARLAVERGLV